MKITGGCHCGKIAFEAEVNPENVVICHCTDCQSLSGSAFRSVVISDKDAFKFTSGEPKTYIKMGDSGNEREQTFCPDCGSPIYSAPVGDDPKNYGIRLGTVKQRDVFEPKKQIWCRSAQNWIQEINSLPKVEKQ